MRPISRITKRPAGFTLLELLLAVTLGAVVLSAVYASFSTGIDTQRRVARVAGHTQAWRFFAERLRADLKNMILIEDEPALQGDARTLTLRALLPGQPPRQISYGYRRGGGSGAGQIRRRYATLNTGDNASEDVNEEANENAETLDTVVFENVGKLAFRYLIDGTWRDRVDDDEERTLPRAVECTVLSAGRERRFVIAVEVQHAAG